MKKTSTKKRVFCTTCGVSLETDKDEKPFHVKIRRNGPRVHMTSSKMSKVLRPFPLVR